MAVGSKDTPHHVEDVSLRSMILVDAGAMNAPNLATLSNECIHSETRGIVVHVSEEASMSEQIPYARYPSVPVDDDRSEVLKELQDVTNPVQFSRVVGRLWIWCDLVDNLRISFAVM